eukprot:1868722-Lingulodinium_polyedra.AAC.1
MPVDRPCLLVKGGLFPHPGCRPCAEQGRSRMCKSLFLHSKMALGALRCMLLKLVLLAEGHKVL